MSPESNSSSYAKFISVLLACAYFAYYAATYESWHFIDNVNLIFHEAGHTMFFFTGQLMSILAGSALQVFIPACVAVYFFLQWQLISSAVCVMWMGQNLLNVSVYASDAQRMQLPLLGGDAVIHDWNFILSNMGLLAHADTVGGAIYGLGLFFICVGAAWALHISWKDARNQGV